MLGQYVGNRTTWYLGGGRVKGTLGAGGSTDRFCSTVSRIASSCATVLAFFMLETVMRSLWVSM